MVTTEQIAVPSQVINRAPRIEAATGVFSWCAAQEEITASAPFYRIFDLDPARPMTLALIATRVHPDDLRQFYGLIDQARGAISDLNTALRLRLPNGSIKYLHWMAHRLQNRDGRLEYIGAVHDATALHLSEQALTQARADLTHLARLTSLGVLMASIVHEISQPILGMMTNASTCLAWLAADPPHLDAVRESARHALRDAERAGNLVTRLRALFRKEDPEPASLDLNEAIREVLTWCSCELRRQRVVLKTDLAGSLPQVVGDRVQLQQVVINLLLNAVDAMNSVEDRPRTLLIRTEQRDGDQICVVVRDAGAVVQSRNMETLFEAFYTTKRNGLGIGLCVSRFIIEGHRGRLWAEPNETHGATFTFSLPRGLQVH
jgi:C4-dicarboxylate-specific signal transduction histidine kinase